MTVFNLFCILVTRNRANSKNEKTEVRMNKATYSTEGDGGNGYALPFLTPLCPSLATLGFVLAWLLFRHELCT